MVFVDSIRVVYRKLPKGILLERSGFKAMKFS